MGTLQTLMFYHLPPVGNSVCLYSKEQIQSDSSVVSLLSSDQVLFYASGTAALSAAVVAAIKVKNIERAEVILPAYGCPDLISAVEFAGAKPVLVDIEVDRPWLDLARLASVITESTVAIIAVNLFGISERWLQLQLLAKKSGVVLIEDSAQYFPGAEERQDWHGDLVVFSFGRGKPVSMLGGGAVFVNNSHLFKLLPRPEKTLTPFRQQLMYALKAKLYNVMISPYLYWLPQSLPFLHLGETRYHTLQAIEAMDQKRIDLLPANISCYQDDVDAAARCEKVSLMLGSLANIQGKLWDLPRVCNVKENRRLLRYPLLLKASSRDSVYQKLEQAGLGASIMYPVSLSKIPGVNHLLDGKQKFPNAEDFASRVLTLPTHAGVTEADVDKMKVVLSELK